MTNKKELKLNTKGQSHKFLSVFISIFVLVCSINSHAKSSAKQLIDMVRQSPYSNWGLNLTLNSKKDNPSINLIQAAKLYKPNKPVTVAVIDTGINYNHPHLKQNLYFKGEKAAVKHFGVDFSKTKYTLTPHDEHGHGTHVAGIIKTIFPQVRILALKYYNPKASGQENLNATIKALKYAVDRNVDIINYSGGGPEASAEEKKVLEEAEKKGILVIAAAGNESSNIDVTTNAYFPASYNLSNIVTVAAYDQSIQLLSTSNYGKKSVDIAAPGFRIKSATAKNIYRNREYAFMSGTSQATAFVTGVAAILKSQYPNLSSKEIKKIILSSAEFRPQFSGKIATSGKLNAYRALQLAGKYSSGSAKEKKRALAKFQDMKNKKFQRILKSKKAN
jgi:subtilisin family serine protease